MIVKTRSGNRSISHETFLGPVVKDEVRTSVEVSVDEVLVPPIPVPETVKGKVVELITDVILSGKVKPGERLNESELARQLGVSRAPVREGLQQLQEQGFVVNVPRRGMFLVRLDEEAIQKINSLRLIIESEALRLARVHLTPEGKAQLEEIIEKMERIGPTPTNQARRIDFEFHRTIWRMSGNEYLERLLVSLTSPLFAHAALEKLHAEQRVLIQDSHRPLLEFVLGNSSQTAEEAMLMHLQVRYSDPARFSSLTKKP